MELEFPVVVFDFMGVVFSENHIVTRILTPLIQGKNPNFPSDEIRRRYQAITLGRIGSSDFWNGIAADPPAADREFCDSYSLDPDFLGVVDYLRPKYRLAALSNQGREWADYVIEKFGLREIFGEIVVSAYHGFRKPSPELFQVLLDKLDSPPESCIYVDDRLENLEAAKELGVSTVHYEREENPLDYKPDYTIKELGQLKEIL